MVTKAKFNPSTLKPSWNIISKKAAWLGDRFVTIQSHSGIDGSLNWDYDTVGRGFHVVTYDQNVTYPEGVDKTNIIVRAEFDHPDGFFYGDSQIAAFTIDGEFIWKFPIGDNQILSYIPTGIVIDDNGDIYSHSASSFTAPVRNIFSMDSDGNSNWNASSATAFGINMDKTQSFLLTIRRSSISPQVAKSEVDGNFLWWKSTIGVRNVGEGIFDNASNIIVVGGRDNLHIAASFNTLSTRNWDYNPGGTGTRTQQRLVAVDSNDNVIVTGHARNEKSVWSIDNTGSLNWDFNCGPITMGVIIDDADNIYICGYDGTDTLWKFNSAGSLLWKKFAGSGAPQLCKFDSAGNIFIFGNYNISVPVDNLYKFDTSGTKLWSKTVVNGSGSLAIDANDDVVTCGWRNKA